MSFNIIRATTDEDVIRYQKHSFIDNRRAKCSIVLNNVFKNQNRKAVLNGLSFIAYNSQICVILGEIQSGKSMLLSCLVGRNKVDRGYIWVLGGKPKTKSSKTLTKYVGYMPQEFCLYEYNKMTVQEMLKYFGDIYGISEKFIQWRMAYYSDNFTLPPMNAIIRNLNFSEKRMVSFIIAVFHRPRLVVLDEPTVGLDILKRNQIWKYLNHINSTWKPTIIVSTNNIDDAFSATKVAYLKNGKIVLHEDVEDLVRMYTNRSQDFNLQDFYSNIMSNLHENVSIDLDQTELPHDKKISLFKQIVRPRLDIWKLKTIIFQYLLFLTKNTWIFMLVFIFPTLQIILHCTNFGVYPKTTIVAIYNEETDCADNQCNNIVIDRCDYLSCHFINLLTLFEITATFYNNVDEAKYSVINGSAIGYIQVSNNYTKSLIQSIKNSSAEKRDNSLLNNSISIEIDLSDYEYGLHLKNNLLKAQKEHLTNIYKHLNLSTKYAETPVKLIQLPNLGFTENSAIGIIACAIFSSTMLYSALLLQSEIENGNLMRNLVAGVTFLEIILSFLTINITLSIIHSLISILIVEFMLFMSWQSSLLIIIALNITIGINGMGIGLFIGSCINGTYKVLQVSLVVFLLNIILSGEYWPLSYIEYPLRNLAPYLPLSLSIQATKGVLIYVHQLKTKDICNSLISSACWTLLSIIAFTFNIKNNKDRI